MEGRAPLPRAAATLGLELVEADSERAPLSSRSTDGGIHQPRRQRVGAFVAAMLYDTVGPALLATLEPDQFQSTLELNVNFLRPVRPGRVPATGVSSTETATLAFLEASLVDSHGALIATATATARVIPLERARSAA